MPGVCPGGGGMLKLRFEWYNNVISTVLLWSLFCWGWNNQDALCYARLIDTYKFLSQTPFSKENRAKIINYEPLFIRRLCFNKRKTFISRCLRVSRKLRSRNLRLQTRKTQTLGYLENSNPLGVSKIQTSKHPDQRHATVAVDIWNRIEHLSRSSYFSHFKE